MGAEGVDTEGDGGDGAHTRAQSSESESALECARHS